MISLKDFKITHCRLASIGPDGLSKNSQKSFKGFASRYNEELCVLNQLKPITISGDELLKEFNINVYSEEYMYAQLKKIILVLLFRQNNIKYIEKNDDVVIEIDEKFKPVNREEISASVITIFAPEYENYAIFYDMRNNGNIPEFDNLPNFNMNHHDYINGVLLGYDQDDIRGYLLRGYIQNKLREEHKQHKFPKLTDESYIEKFKSISTVMEKSGEMKKFDKLYKTMKTHMDKLLDKYLDNPPKKYLEQSKHIKIKDFPVPKITFFDIHEEKMMTILKKLKPKVNKILKEFPIRYPLIEV